MLTYFPGSEAPIEVWVLEGREAIQAQARVLETFAESCGQPGAMHWLHYFLNGQKVRFKQPFLVLLVRAGARAAMLKRTDLLAAALYFEYRIRGLRTRTFSTDDLSGLRTVVAPEALRSHVAAIATEALMRQGAHVVLTSYESYEVLAGVAKADLPIDLRDKLWAHRARSLGKHLVLEPTFAATMAKLGKRTRTHMRYYQRRLIARSGCTFHPHASALVSEEAFAVANRQALNPVSAEECGLRFRSSCELPGGFLCGLRAADGQWLSLAGGWRQGGVSVLQWQINAAGFERDSLRTVMRTFLLEHEVERGAERLEFYGGTSHSMRHSFEPQQICDLVVRRRSLRAGLVMAAAKLAVRRQEPGGKVNFLAETLHAESLLWRRPGERLAGWDVPPQRREVAGRPAAGDDLAANTRLRQD